MDHVRALLRHRGNVVSTRTLRVPRAEERGGGVGGEVGLGRADLSLSF